MPLNKETKPNQTFLLLSACLQKCYKQSKGRGTLNSKQSYPAKKLTLCLNLLISEGLFEYIYVCLFLREDLLSSIWFLAMVQTA